jgi:hypothetical protein
MRCGRRDHTTTLAATPRQTGHHARQDTTPANTIPDARKARKGNSFLCKDLLAVNHELSGRTLALPSLVVTLTQPPSGIPPSASPQCYNPHHFYYYFTSALTRQGDVTLPYHEREALRCAFARMAHAARTMNLINGGTVVYDYYLTWLLDAEKVTMPQQRNDSIIQVKQCSGHDDHDKEFETLAQMFKAEVDAAITHQNNSTHIISVQGKKSTRRIRRSAGTPSTTSAAKYTPPSQ